MSLPWNDNIPHGIKEPGDMEEPKMKKCSVCNDNEALMPCEACDNMGEIPMTWEEEREEQEAKNEPNDL